MFLWFCCLFFECKHVLVYLFLRSDKALSLRPFPSLATGNVLAEYCDSNTAHSVLFNIHFYIEFLSHALNRLRHLKLPCFASISVLVSVCFYAFIFRASNMFSLFFCFRLRCDLQLANSQIQRLKQGRSSSRRTRELPGSQFAVNDDSFSGGFHSDSPRPSSPTSTVDFDSGKQS